MRMALAAFRSASDRHIVRGRQSSCAMRRSWHRTARRNPVDLSALSVQQKQDHSFATHTKQRTLVKLFGLHASCILVSTSDRSCITSFTGFASVAPVRVDRTGTSSRNLFTSEISQHIVEQSAVELVLHCCSLLSTISVHGALCGPCLVDHGNLHCAVLPQRTPALCCILRPAGCNRQRPTRIVKRLCALLVNLLFTTAFR